MTPPLAAAKRSQVSTTGPMMRSWGPLKSRTVNAPGLGVYDATFTKVMWNFRLLLSPRMGSGMAHIKRAPKLLKPHAP
jgi:hypothetical protein